LYESFHNWYSSLVSISFLGLHKAAEAPLSRAAGFLNCHSSSKVLLDEHIEVRAQLFVKVTVETILPEQSSNARSEFLKSAHLNSPDMSDNLQIVGQAFVL